MPRLFLVPLLFLTACTVGSAPPLSQPSLTPSGANYAWVIFDQGRLLRSEAFGLADRKAARVLTVDDPVRIASISKLVVALGVLRLVETGRLDLDADVSERLGWRLRNPAFPNTPITLRLLLSHRSSLRDEIEYAIPLGRDLRSALADVAAFDPGHAPGRFFRYSNLNFPVVASVMEAAVGERFDRLMDRLVLKPLGLDACFNWTTCSEGAAGRAVVLYASNGSVLRDDLGGKFPACPVATVAGGGCDLSGYRPGTNGALFSPQGGLRISARDLATVGQVLLGRGTYRGGRFLTEASMAELAGPAWRFDGANGDTSKGFYCAYGLASQSLPVAETGCRDDLFGNRATAVGHAGDAYGVLSGLWIDPKRGRGIAYFATANGEAPRQGRSAYRAVEEWLAGKLKQ